jgi:formate/nitrite transporter FocA (FNT family)
MKFIVILFLVGIVGSLGSALYFIMKDKGGGERAVKALTLRVAFSVALFLLLMAGTYFGLVTQKL